MQSGRLRALGLVATAPAVSLLAPGGPVACWSLLGATGDPTTPLVGLVGLAAYACSGWLVLLAALTVGTRLPGQLGRLCGAVTARLAPASVRALLRLALGTTVAVTALSASSALADPRPAVTSSFEWPGASVAPSPAPQLDWGAPPVRVVPRPVAPDAPRTRPPVHSPASPASSHPVGPAVGPAVGPVAGPVVGPVVGPAVTRPGDSHAVVVLRGDSLWRIASRDLGPSATPAQVAQAWPRWWTANRDVLGDHPELLHPGERLVAPPS